MIDVDEAQRIVLSLVKPGPIVDLPLREALFRTLAEPVVCDVDYPPFDRALMDGYAVQSADVGTAPVALTYAGQIAAGSMPERALIAGEAMQINTGAPIPRGADAVVRVEDTELREEGKQVTIKRAVKVGEFITPRASYVRAGQEVLATGTRLSALEMAVCASAGAARVRVYRKPSIGLLSTGDELVEVERRPTGAQIRNSNAFLLDALVRGEHAEPVVLGVARDNRAALQERITAGLQCDMLCLTGGVSMGAFDLVPGVLAECGVAFHFQKMSIKPGRPVIFGLAPTGTLVFALPGNPISAFVGFHLLVRPALAAREGRGGMIPPLHRATLRGSMAATTSRRSYWPGRAEVRSTGEWEVTPLSWQGSGDPFGMACANVLIMRPPHSPAVGAGDRMSVVAIDVMGF